MSGNGWFGGLGGASANGGGAWIEGGVYDIEILRITRHFSNNPKSKGNRLVITEARVVKVLLTQEAEDGFKASNRVGEHVSIICNLDGAYPSMELGRLKGILGAALGDVDEELLAMYGIPADHPEPWAAVAEAVTAPPGDALAGVVIRAIGTRKMSAKNRPIVALSFTAVPTSSTEV